MGAILDLVGNEYGMIRVIKYHGRINRQTNWLCECKCGTVKVIGGRHLRSGRVVSCGCYRINNRVKHGQSKLNDRSSEYGIWNSMIQRCVNPKSKAFHAYGKRGIKVCDQWMDFENFFRDMGKRPSKEYSIERIDNDGNYEPINCKWATKVEQGRNTRKPITNSSGHIGVHYFKRTGKYQAYITCNQKRINLGYHETIEQAVIARKRAEKKYWGKESA